ncbi:U-box domain-containing protein 4-like [Phalaenopsis equestris]|uniref:U-box domain-containing protein 4-like n=1 Tax=Phalaenopsis equestris TaxID=78828 RepID=UPI0009E38141|nr:U-box domain-containing protein 4-like [Phalaenopsis equestris]XP_020580167.1 U-box domain-containing protein 4-like [Phalaenopsis equestris]XP_020580168.1 U-box domain-containing protein 4-like [Phalaenopsis equestris]
MSEKLTDSMVDIKFQEFASDYMSCSAIHHWPDPSTDLLELSGDFSDSSSFSYDISGEIQRLASFFDGEVSNSDEERGGNELGLGFLSSVSDEILESGSPAIVKPLVRSCVETLGTSFASLDAKRAAAGNLRLLAKHRSDFRELIGRSGAIQTLIPLLRCTDPIAQENAVTALLNLSLEESNKTPITAAGAIKPLVYALRTGTATSKQNAACALLSLSMIEENQIIIGVCGAIPPLVSLLVNGSSRGKQDALTTLYKLCDARQNKQRAVSAGAVTPLVALVAEGRGGTTEKAIVVLSRLSEIKEGREAIVEESGIPALVEALEAGPANWKEFAVITLLHLCRNSERNRGLVVREGVVQPLVALSQSSSSRTKHKAHLLLKYLREPRQDGPFPPARGK